MTTQSSRCHRSRIGGPTAAIVVTLVTTFGALTLSAGDASATPAEGPSAAAVNDLHWRRLAELNARYDNVSSPAAMRNDHRGTFSISCGTAARC